MNLARTLFVPGVIIAVLGCGGDPFKASPSAGSGGNSGTDGGSGGSTPDASLDSGNVDGSAGTGGTADASGSGGAGGIDSGRDVGGSGDADGAANNCMGIAEFKCIDACPTPNPAKPAVCIDGRWDCPNPDIQTTKCPEYCGELPNGFGCCDSANMAVSPVCVDRKWQCPQGSAQGACGCPQPPPLCCAQSSTPSTQASPQCTGQRWECPSGTNLVAPPGTCDGTVRSCALASTCPSNQFCEYPDDRCGANGTMGTCVDRPSFCRVLPSDEARVCACDRKVYDSPCEASRAGQDIAQEGICALSIDQFACGSNVCSRKSQYCRVTKLDSMPRAPATFRCVLLPAICASAALDVVCACLNKNNVACANTCRIESPSNAPFVTCSSDVEILDTNP